MSKTDYEKFYYLEKYLFSEVSVRFNADSHLTAFDFFCIVIWKSNRSKSKIAELILQDGKYSSYQVAINELIRDILSANTNEARMRSLLVKWKLRLPMASAILTVLYPEDFTVYDVRVCEVLKMPEEHQYATSFASLWARYCLYLQRVLSAKIDQIDLRARDRYMWGRSFALDLKDDIQARFPRSDCATK